MKRTVIVNGVRKEIEVKLPKVEAVKAPKKEEKKVLVKKAKKVAPKAEEVKKEVVPSADEL